MCQTLTWSTNMPPKPLAHLTSNGVKRKSRDDSDDEQPVKRTRGSGLAPSHFVPLDGAPEPDASKKQLPSSTSTLPASPTKRSSTVKPKPWSPTKKTPKTRPVLESDREDEEDAGSQANSEDEALALTTSPSKRLGESSKSIHKLSTDKKRVPKTEVLSARKPKVGE